MSRFSYFASLLAAVASTVHAQTSTTCQPLNETCSPDVALGTSHTWNFSSNSILDSTWNITNGAVDYTDNAMKFSIAKKLDSPTIKSNFYIFFGRMEYHVQAAPGKGVISSVVLESDDLDEIDWEWVGASDTQVQSNFFGKGETIAGTGATHNISGSTTDAYHNYTTWWDKDKLEWWYDNTLLRTVTYEDAKNSTTTWYPQTPMTIRIGNWPGGDPAQPEGRIIWAGGVIDYDSGPYNMYVSQISAQDFSSGKEYTYSDHSGDWQSINITAGNSTISNTLNTKHETLAQKWANLAPGAKIAIYASVGGVLGIGLMVLLFCCVKQRRIGKREWNVQNNRFMEERTDMMNLQAEWRQKGYVEMK
jgi:hypothetical protein